MAEGGAGVAKPVDGRVDVERVGKAVDALLRWVEGGKEQQRIRLLDEDQLIYLVVSLKKIPDKARLNPFKLELPHPLIETDGSQEICLIVHDKRGSDRKEARERVLQEGLRVSKVLGFSKLKQNYNTHDARRKLCGSYDLFVVDRRVMTSLPRALGKVFFKKKKHPIAIDLSRGQWKNQFEKICRSAFLYVTTGNCCVVKVAKMSQTKEEIMTNVLAVIEAAVDCIPKKWESVLALHLKTQESLALPIYQSSPSMPLKIDVNLQLPKSTIQLPRIPGKEGPAENDDEQDGEQLEQSDDEPIGKPAGEQPDMPKNSNGKRKKPGVVKIGKRKKADDVKIDKRKKGDDVKIDKREKADDVKIGKRGKTDGKPKKSDAGEQEKKKNNNKKLKKEIQIPAGEKKLLKKQKDAARTSVLKKRRDADSPNPSSKKKKKPAAGVELE